MGQTRIIEKKGLIIPTNEERESLWLSLTCLMLQKPSNENLNHKYNPSKGWYGIVQLISQGYVFRTVPIEYYFQKIYFGERYSAQLLEVMGGAFAEQNDILTSISLRCVPPVAIILLPSQPINFPRIELTEARVKLMDGVICQFSLINEPFKTALNSSITEPIDPPVPSVPPSGSPPVPKPLNEPPRSGLPASGAEIEITPPYNPSTNDGGNTFVPGAASPESYTTAGNLYKVNVKLTINDGGVPSSSNINEYANLPGPIGGLSTNDPGNPDADYGIRYSGTQIRGVIKNYQRYGYQGRINGFLIQIVSITKQ